MNDKEIGEIRRRFKIERTNINMIYGCYVNDRREIVSKFEQSSFETNEHEREMYLSMIKKVFSGTLNKNLLDINFKTSQVVNSEEHKLLMDLRNTELKDEEIRDKLYNIIIENIMIEDNYLILLAGEKYDVPYKGKDGASFDELSEQTFNYFTVAICPVKESTECLEFVPQENIFHNSGTFHKASSPIVGFMFPCFDDRATNLYNALYYTKQSYDNHPELAKALFDFELNAPADTEKELFQSALRDSLGDACTMDTIQAVQNKLEFAVLEHKESKNPEALTLSKNAVLNILEDSGVEDTIVEEFSKKFIEDFGEEGVVSPKNLVNQRQFEVNTPNVVIKVKPEFKELISTKIIDGKKYVLIDAENSVEVNGICVEIIE